MFHSTCLIVVVELFVVGNQMPNLVSLFVVEVLVVVAVVGSQIPNLDSFLVVAVLVAMAVVVGVLVVVVLDSCLGV